MTIRQIRESDKVFLFASDISDIVECSPNSIREQAHRDPLKLGFPVVVIGNQVRIPRKAFLFFYDYGYLKGGEPDERAY